ncbi:hypothetical protein C7435_2411 [Maricaulis maris]|uniref:Uncharacterized protein n=1 Tax=Maricaulis maris TaxID=74318 RepID=A0A495D313_9PROT|nr:hypothetical protein C7435_2411 [Maricaulis maris]
MATACLADRAPACAEMTVSEAKKSQNLSAPHRRHRIIPVVPRYSRPGLVIRGRWEYGARPVAWKHRQTNPAWPSMGRQHKARLPHPIGFETGPVTALTKSPCAGYHRCHSHCQRKPASAGPRTPHIARWQHRGAGKPARPLHSRHQERIAHVTSPPRPPSSAQARGDHPGTAGRGGRGRAGNRPPLPRRRRSGAECRG